ncbi:MAG: hypothetical protein ABH879_06500 [archaeon]
MEKESINEETDKEIAEDAKQSPAGDSFELGGNIVLKGFRDIDRANMVIVKKMVGSYARRMTDLSPKFESLTLDLKKIHETEKSEKYEVQAKLINDGKPMNSSSLERNIFFAIDRALGKIVSELE